MRCIAIAAAKGGTGKTTTAVTVAHALALAGHRVLLIDCDPRRHVALHFGLACEPGLAAWLRGRPARSLEVRAGLRILDSGGAALADLEADPAAARRAAARLGRALAALGDTDFVLFDTGAGGGILQRAVLSLADEILLPVGADYLSLASAGAWLTEWEKGREADASVPLVGLVATFVDATLRSAAEVEAVLAEQFSGRVLATRVHSCDALRAAPAQRGTVFDSDPLSQAALDYALLAEELTAGLA